MPQPARIIPFPPAPNRTPEPDFFAATARRKRTQMRTLAAFLLVSAALHLAALLAPLPQIHGLQSPQPLSVTVVTAQPPAASATAAPAASPRHKQPQAEATVTKPELARAPVMDTPSPILALSRPDAAPVPAQGVPEQRPAPATAAAAVGPARPAAGGRVAVSYLHNPLPEYPSVARRRGQEGLATLDVLVNAQGQPQEVKLAKSSGYPLLDDAALDAVKRWTFAPAREDGAPIAARVEVPVRFRLESR